MIKRAVHLTILLLASPLAAADEVIPPVSLFTLPKVELKSAATNEASAPETVLNKEDDSAAEDFALTKETLTIVSEATIQSFETMNGSSVLRAVERPVELGGAAGWLNENVWDPVFAPEVVKVGKVKMTGGIVAAIKRKNPFCLLHPLVFAAGW